MKKSKRKVILGFLLIIVLTIAGGVVSYQGIGKKNTGSAKNIDLGLDLAGGVSITYEVQGKKISQKDMDDTIYKLQKRVEGYSTESEVYQEGDKRIKIEIPGVTDANTILDELGQPGTLSFMTPDGQTVLTGSNVKSANAETGDDNGTKKYYVALEFDKEGTKAFATATKTFLGQQIFIIYDNQIVSAPTVNSEIKNGECVIEGMESFEAAENLASSIRIGALPVELKELSSNVVSAKLGANAIESTLKAGGIGFALVAIFMVVMYLLPGLCASLALVSYIVMMLLALNGFNVTLTLPGLAGIILTIGMAVDANVIIYTRIREELARGKNVLSAIKEGFSKASSAILDGNITTLIAAAVLYMRGTGYVKGFAQTLAIGIIISMFTALVISRILTYAFYYFGCKEPKYYGTLKEHKKINYVKLSKKCMILSLVVILAGFAFMPVNRANKDIGHVLNFSLEFSGGTASTITFDKDTKLTDKLEASVVDLYEEVSESANVQTQKVTESNQVVIKTKNLSLEQRETLEDKLTKDYHAEAVTCENISSTISGEMQRDAIIAVIIATICMLIYIAFRFKDVKFGGSAVIALIHDVLVVLTVYSIGRLTVGSNFIACMLTIVGYSINATIIIFDRIRENLKAMDGENVTLEDTVNMSINQTFTRTINTSITTFIMVVCLFALGSSTLREFALTLMAGIVCGAYSSVCITGPIWYWLKSKESKKEKSKPAIAKTASAGSADKTGKRTGKRHKRH